MTAMRSFATTLKRFQQDAVDNATTLLSGCLKSIDKVKTSTTFQNDRQSIINDQGAILFEAPTGTGKTLMIGHVVERVSKRYPIVWLWFAPFSGLIDQATKTIHIEFPGLHPRNPTIDRETQNLKSGDVFVTTWASVAVNNADSRKTRSETEMMPSLDDLIGFARSNGFFVGVVIDEAHHSFRGQSQAFAFYKDVLKPELTILASATPRDADVEKFCRACDIKDLRRTSISRQQGVDAGLIKLGVKAAKFNVPADVSRLIDFQKTALRQGVAGIRDRRLGCRPSDCRSHRKRNVWRQSQEWRGPAQPSAVGRPCATSQYRSVGHYSFFEGHARARSDGTRYRIARFRRARTGSVCNGKTSGRFAHWRG